MAPLPLKRKVKSLVIVTLSGICAYSGISIYNGNEKFYNNYVMPLVHLLDPEGAHKLAIFASKHRVLPKSRFEDPALLKTTFLGKQLSNPLGIAAGFDKHAEAVLGLYDIGFGFVEVGSVTPLPQPGNQKPRVFRLKEDRAVINRYGFNSDGHDAVLKRLEEYRKISGFNGVVGVNLGKNKTEDAITDYTNGIKRFGSVCDYIVVNISSPNTPGLRNMQTKAALTELLKKLREARNNMPENSKPPLLLKLAPDLTYQERKDIAEVIRQRDCRIDGLIVCNTTIERPETLKNVENKQETGGLSGQPLKDISTQMISDMYQLTNGMPIIGVGGVETGKDAYEKIQAGASVIQLYTSMVYEGPPVVTKVKKELAELLVADGYSNIQQAVGKYPNKFLKKS